MEMKENNYAKRRSGRCAMTAEDRIFSIADPTGLKNTLGISKRFGALIGQSKSMQKVYDTVIKVAASNANVHIFGESGTGKELVARTIHELSSRHAKPFVPVNCGAIPEGLVENEFFGHKKGAFTDAVSDCGGYLGQAEGGTLFLDEVAELNLSMQVKLLRAIDDGGFMPVGGNFLEKTNIRIISATNRDLRDAVRQGKVREDFYYRIIVLSIDLPPLRERGDDLMLLADYFSRIYSEELLYRSIPDEVIRQLKRHDWPGNVRELQNVIQRYLIFKSISFFHPNLARQRESDRAEPLMLFNTEFSDEISYVQ